MGKDVESIIKDIVALTVKRVKSEETEKLREKYYDLAVEKVAKLINNLDTLDDEFKNNLVEHIKSGKFDDAVVEMDKSQYEQRGPVIEYWDILREMI